jgi:hypothetical protein
MRCGRGRSQRLETLAIVSGFLLLFWTPAGANSGGSDPGRIGPVVCPEVPRAAPNGGLGTSVVTGREVEPAETVCSAVADEFASLTDPSPDGGSPGATCERDCSASPQRECQGSSDAAYGGGCQSSSGGEYDRPSRARPSDRDCEESCAVSSGDDCRGPETASPPSAPPAAAPPPNRPASEAPSSAGPPVLKVSGPTPAPGTQISSRERAAAAQKPSSAPLPRTGSRSRPLVAMVGVVWIVGGVTVMASGRSRRLSLHP